MKTFIDNAGRTWTVSVNISALKRLRDLLGVNLMEAIEGNLLERLTTDPMLLCDTVYVLCKPEADKLEISDEDFGGAMGGDAIEGATVALLEELVNFFPPGKRRVLQKAISKWKAVEEKALEFAEAKLDSPELDQEINSVLKNITDFALNSQPSSA